MQQAGQVQPDRRGADQPACRMPDMYAGLQQPEVRVVDQLMFLALAMTGVVLLVTDFIFGTLATTIATTMSALLFATLWYVIPYRRRLQLQAAEREQSTKQ